MACATVRREHMYGIASVITMCDIDKHVYMCENRKAPLARGNLLKIALMIDVC